MSEHYPCFTDKNRQNYIPLNKKGMMIPLQEFNSMAEVDKKIAILRDILRGSERSNVRKTIMKLPLLEAFSIGMLQSKIKGE